MKSKTIELRPSIFPVHENAEIKIVGIGKSTYLWVGATKLFLGTVEGANLRKLADEINRRMPRAAKKRTGKK
jgi:hypothetical protein